MISECPKQKISPGREVVCYTSVSEVEQLTEAICRCTTLVQKGLDVRNLSVSGKSKSVFLSLWWGTYKTARLFERQIPWFLIIAMIEARRSYRMIFHLLWKKGKKKERKTKRVGRSCWYMKKTMRRTSFLEMDFFVKKQFQTIKISHID